MCFLTKFGTLFAKQNSYNHIKYNASIRMFMKRILFMAMLGGISLTTVQCTKTIEERVEVIRERGNAILSGNGAPNSSLGKVGDYYLDLSGVNLYGAKTAEGWGSPISLRGLKGEVGATGQNGADAPVPNIKGGYWYIGETNTGIKAEGKDGSNGSNGKDGITPTISDDGYWVVNGQKTNIKAKGTDGTNGQNGSNGANGKDGKDGITPTISADGYWIVNGQKTDIKAKGTDGTNGKNGSNGANGKDGKDGITPTISADGYWVVNGQKTNIKAKGTDGTNGQNGSNGTNGKDGKDGKDGITPTITINSEGYWVINGQTSTTKAKAETPHIGSNGNWFIGTQDTNIKAQGPKGDTGATGAQGDRGERGLPGKDGSVIYADKGKPTTQGKDGDYYIDTEAKIFYGPKANYTWPTTGISLTGKNINSEDYVLSADGKTLLEWKNLNTRFIDMNADPKLREVTKIDKAFNFETIGRGLQLTTIIVGDKVTEISMSSFNTCEKLKTVELPEGITKIGKQAFANCTNLRNINIPDELTKIETRVFFNCTRLTHISLPEKVREIEPAAFQNCKSLHTITILNPTAFQIKAMINTNFRNIYVPSGSADAYKAINDKYKDIIR